MKNALNLNQFMLRIKVLQLYKDFLLSTRGMAKQERKEVIEWIKPEFKKHVLVEDEEKIKTLISFGRNQLRTFQGSISLSKHTLK